MDNHKESIRDNNKGLSVARHFNKPDHSICDLECVILKGDFSNSKDRLIEEQTLIHKLKTDTHGLNWDLDFLTPYTYFHKWYTSPSTHTPLTFDLHLWTVATLTSLNNLPLLTGTYTSGAPLPPPHSLDAWLTYGNSGHSYFTLQRSFADFSWRRATDEDCRCGRKFCTLYIFYWIKVLELPFAVSFSVLHIYIYTYIWWTKHSFSLSSTCWFW